MLLSFSWKYTGRASFLLASHTWEVHPEGGSEGQENEYHLYIDRNHHHDTTDLPEQHPSPSIYGSFSRNFYILYTQRPRTYIETTDTTGNSSFLPRPSSSASLERLAPAHATKDQNFFCFYIESYISADGRSLDTALLSSVPIPQPSTSLYAGLALQTIFIIASESFSETWGETTGEALGRAKGEKKGHQGQQQKESKGRQRAIAALATGP